MLTLVYKGGEFSFEENLPAAPNDSIVDMDLIIQDDIPQSQQNALMNRACDYVINYMERVIRHFREVGVVQNLVIYRVLICSILD